jgi:copper homeostasis protein (lipoprotein)
MKSMRHGRMRDDGLGLARRPCRPIALSPSLRLPLLFLLLALAACQRQQDPAPAARDKPDLTGPLADFGGERTWQGVLPCSDCLGIDTRLVLREQGGRRRYRLEETYLGAPEPNRFDHEGSWTEVRDGDDDSAGAVYVLDPDSAPRRFRLQPDGGIELLTGSTDAASVPEYRLQRL